MRSDGSTDLDPGPTVPVPVRPNGTGTGAHVSSLGRRAFADSPPGYPNPFVWLRSGILRDWRGPLGALVSTWFYVPVGLALAVYGAIALGVVGMVGAGFGLHGAVPEPLRDAPLVGSAIDSFVFRSGGALAMLAGVVLGAVGGLLTGVALPWLFGDTGRDPLSIAGAVAGIVVAGALVGVAYTVYRVVCERWLLGLTGARRPSRREQEFLLPILHECARRLALPAVPRLLIEDRQGPNAHAYTRHLVLNSGLLEDFGYRPEPIAAVVCHELVHWRNGDAVTSAFVRGLALPLYLIHSFATWIMRVFPHPVIRFLVWVVFWPFLITVRYVVMPLQAVDTRRAEMRADQGAVLAGYRGAMREVLLWGRRFESGRSGWDEAVCATHPPAELRLEMLETPERRYPLDSPHADPLEAPDAGAVHDPDLAAWVFVPPRAGSRTGWAVAGAVAAVLVLVLGGLAVVQATVFTPERAVTDYFAALSHRDAAAAGRLTVGGADGSLPAAVLRGDGYQPPTDVRILKVTTAAGSSTVDITYQLATGTASASMTVTRDSGSTWGVFHAWHIADGWFPIDVPTGDGVTVDGVPVTAPDGPMGALPGTYLVGEADSPLVSVPPVPVAVGPGQPESAAVQFQPALRTGAQAQIGQLVDGYLDKCAQSTDLQPANCPFGYGFYSTSGTAHWKMLNYPQLSVTVRDMTHADVSTASAGQVQSTVDGETSDSTVDVTGTVTVSGGQLVWQPNS